MLYYTIPQKNTNELAHALIDRFGSLSDVLDAPYEELIKVRGIKGHSALFLNLLPEIVKLYLKDEKKDIAFDFENTGKYLVQKFSDIKTESVFALAFNKELILLDEFVLPDCSVSSANFNMKSFFEKFTISSVCHIVLAHNHPNGIPIPSSDDFTANKNITDFLNTLNINLLEHYIICGKNFSGIINYTGKIF